MPGYADTKKLIEDTLVNRPAGTVIVPEDHQTFALSMLDYIHAVELLGASSLQGAATVDTVPVQPIGSRVSYISSVPPGQTYVYTNFLDENGQAISVTSGANTVSLLTLLWNGTYWTVSTTPVTLAVGYTNGYLFKGIAVPTDNPGTPDQNVFYIASQTGTYTNFGGLAVADGEVAILRYNGSWTKEVTGAATSEKLIQLRQEVEAMELNSFFVGVGQNFAYKDIYGLVPGSAYRIILRDTIWDISGIAGSTTEKFSIKSVNNGVETNLVSVNLNSVVKPYYDIIVPDDSNFIRIGGRAASGSKVYFNVQDGEIGNLVNKYSESSVPSIGGYYSKYLKNDGSLVDLPSSASWSVNEYLVTPGSRLKVSGGILNNHDDSCLGAFYQEDGTFISIFYPNTSTSAIAVFDYKVTVPENAYLLRVAFGVMGERADGQVSVKVLHDFSSIVRVGEVLPEFDWASEEIQSNLQNFKLSIGDLVIRGGDVAKLTKWYTGSNYSFESVMFDIDALYDCHGFYYRYDKTHKLFLLLEEQLFSMAERVGGVDLKDLEIQGYRILADGTMERSQTENYTGYIPVNKYQRIHIKSIGYKILGYAEIGSEPITLSSGQSSAVVYEDDIRIPEGIKYIRITFIRKNNDERAFVLSYDASFICGTLNMDSLYPSDSPYTLETALATLRQVDVAKGTRIRFIGSDNKMQEWTFGGDDSSKYSNQSMWVQESEALSAKTYGTYLENVSGADVVVECADALPEKIDISHDWYAELVLNLTGYPTGTQRSIFRLGAGTGAAVINLRYNNTMFQFNIGNSYVISQRMPEGYENPVHLVLVCVNRYVSVYVNGLLWATSANQYTPTFTPTTAAEKMLTLCPYQGERLFRLGYLACTVDGVDYDGADPETIVETHFNGGNPLSYVCNDRIGLLAEFLPNTMHSDYYVNTVNPRVRFFTPSPLNVYENNPYAKVITGEGFPAVLPRYIRQKYIDTLTADEYVAVGTSLLGDWKKFALTSEVAALKTQTKTINGQSIWGSGDIEGGGSGGGSTFVSVIDKGAVGDGVTDDTEAIMTAVEAARANNKALYFPNGTFLTRKSIILTSGMRITGEPNAIIQNAAATIEGGGKCPYSITTADAAQGAHSVAVADASKFRVGDEIVIWKSGSYTETMADITAINGNTITFDTSRFTADGTDGGLLNAVASAGYVLTDFAMFKTIMTKEAVNVVVENITIKPMSDMSEPHIYTSSPISQTKQGGGQPQSNFRVYNVTCYDSANDGISLQGSGDSEVIGCRVFNQKHKGIHFGTAHDKIVISKNYCYGCGSAQYENYSDYQGSGAIFFCSFNHRVIITDNIFENCYKGVYGFNYQGAGEQDTDTIIANNTFKNCGLYGIMLRGGYRAVVVGNIFTDFNNSAIPIHTEAEGNFKFTAGVISNNVFGNFGSAFAGPAIQVTGARNLVLAGNNVSGYINNNASTVRDHCDITVATSEKVAITNNVVDGVIDISDAGNTGIVKDNNIETS